MERAHVSGEGSMAMLSGKDLAPGLAHEIEESLDAPRRRGDTAEALGRGGLGENLDALHRASRAEPRSTSRTSRSSTCSVEQASEADREALDAEFRELLWKWFQRKLVVVEDYYTSGEQLVNQIAEDDGRRAT